MERGDPVVVGCGGDVEVVVRWWIVGNAGTVATIAREEGLAALWKGVVPGLHRQCLFGGLRIGLYEPVKNLYVGENFVGDVPLSKKILAGLTTGALAISIANPTDLVKVRLQAEGKLPPGVPRRYSGALNAYSTIVKQVKSRMMGDPSYKSTVDLEDLEIRLTSVVDRATFIELASSDSLLAEDPRGGLHPEVRRSPVHPSVTSHVSATLGGLDTPRSCSMVGHSEVRWVVERCSQVS
ncbi:Mitochondrial uncoupling protein 1 [Platanthera guangdongensis]|uniref:Mitochondrial uncoupling protein 1 n=1 Tax=Platanthera guangdongensis TaxID=2320717 RepID=A0ABR2LZG2_9ASPA